MNYKETLFFVGKCLTITHEAHNRIIVENEMKSGNVDWDNVVKLSTKHYVFPALYCNLKRVDFLHYLPPDLAKYMKHLTDLNRQRNLQIIEQAKEINELLLANNIAPVFLKGTGNLLEGLYEDIAERMVGDIDFIVSKKDYQKTIEVITNFKYSNVFEIKNNYPSFKHHPRLKKEGRIAAIEIHKELLIEKYAHEFNYEFIKSDVFTVKSITFLSFENQLSLSIIAQYINDAGQYFKSIALRNAYDVFLLSKEINSLNSILRFHQLFKPLNSFLAITNLCLHSEAIIYKKTSESKKTTTTFIRFLDNAALRKRHHKKIASSLFINVRLAIIIKSLYDKKTRIWLIKRLLNGRETI